MAMASWLPEIDPESDFSLNNIPFGVGSPVADLDRRRCFTAIGNNAVDLSKLAEAGLFSDIPNFTSPYHVFSRSTLNEFMEHPRQVWSDVRNRIIDLFTMDSSDDRLLTNLNLQKASIFNIDSIQMHLPAAIGDYTDFYSSIHHATNVGSMFRDPKNALSPNWRHLPVGYHGRSSSVYISGTNVRRPCGQLQKDPTDASKGSLFGPSKLLDFELEIAFFVGGCSNENGRPLSLQEADERIFGFVLMNDWSARDIQKFEYVPLGPFGSKNFATTISPWVVTTMALEKSYSCPTSSGKQVPVPLPYINDPNYSSYDINLFVSIQGQSMEKPELVCTSNYSNMYWNARQQLVHHSVTGCNMKAGDLLGSGTISGTDTGSFGCMLELCWKGTRDVRLGASGETRKFLNDGDKVIMTGYAGGKEFGKVGFGVCSGKILPTYNKACGTDTENEIVTFSQKHHQKYDDMKVYCDECDSRSTQSIRLALTAKAIPFTLIQSGGSASALSPVLECKDKSTGRIVRIGQPLAAISFLDSSFPCCGIPLLPECIEKKAKAMEIVEIAMKIDDENGSDLELQRCQTEKKLSHIDVLVKSLRDELGDSAGPYAVAGFSPTVADICILPHICNARATNIDLTNVCPTLLTIESTCLKQHEWFSDILKQANKVG